MAQVFFYRWFPKLAAYYNIMASTDNGAIKNSERAGALSTHVIVGVKKYYSVKWRGNPGWQKLGPFFCQMILQTIFLWLSMLAWNSSRLEGLVMEEHRQTFEHRAAVPMSATLFDPFPMGCSGFDVTLEWWTLSSPIFDSPPFKKFMEDLRCGSAADVLRAIRSLAGFSTGST